MVSEVFVQEGTIVTKGQKLLALYKPSVNLAGDDSLRESLKQLDSRTLDVRSINAEQSAQVQGQIEGLKRQLSQGYVELDQLKLELEVAEDKLKISNEILRRLELAAKEKVIPEIQLQQHRQQVLDLTSARNSVTRQMLTLKRSLSQTETELQRLPAQLNILRASAHRDIALIQQERIQTLSAAESLVLAPIDGRVSMKSVEVSQNVQPFQHLMSIVPRNSRLVGEFLVPSSAIGFLSVGNRVLMRYDAFPYQKFGHQEGTVERIARSAIDEKSGANGQLDQFFRIRVKLKRQDILVNGVREPLLPGMSMEADVVSDNRRLYEWLFDPILSLRGRL